MKISEIFRVGYGLSVSFMSVREIIKDIEWIRREKRNRKRRIGFVKKNPTTNSTRNLLRKDHQY